MSNSLTFVLVHGGRHGGWCWKRVAQVLRRSGHEVITPTLTGLGDRAHLLNREIGLTTHITDLTAVFEYEDLDDVVLVAHSYGGVVAAGAMEDVYSRVRTLVLVDAHLPESGQSTFDVIGAERAASMMRVCKEHGEGWYLPVSDATYWGVSDPADIEWVNERITPQPIRTYQDHLGSTDRARTHPSTYIECTASTLPAAELEWQRERSKSDPRHRFRMLAAPHDAMVTHPSEVAGLLIEAACVYG